MSVTLLQSKNAIPSPVATEMAKVAAHTWTVRQGTKDIGSSLGDVSAVVGTHFRLAPA
jgi:hypothetical protein